MTKKDNYKSQEKDSHSSSNFVASPQHNWSMIRFLIGFAFGAIVYMLIARTIISQTSLLCSFTETSRQIIEATMFPVSIFFMIFDFLPYRLAEILTYSAASLPYAILGGLLFSGQLKPALILVLLTCICFCLSFVTWVLFNAQMCA